MERNVVWLISGDESKNGDSGNKRTSARICDVWNTTRKALRTTAGLLAPTPIRSHAEPAFEVAVVSERENRQQPPAASESTRPDNCDGYAAAIERVRLVIAWYNRAIHLERRSASPDRSRIETLISERQACVEDQRALEAADAVEIAQVAKAYGARFRHLTRADSSS
jgi:hypothetical protein